MNKKLDKLRKTIAETEKIPQSEKLFAGANLIITNNHGSKKKNHDILVNTKHPKEISWFIFQLKEMFSNDIDYMNKYDFYSHIGNLLNQAILSGKELKDQLNYVIDNIVEFKK